MASFTTFFLSLCVMSPKVQAGWFAGFDSDGDGFEDYFDDQGAWYGSHDTFLLLAPSLVQTSEAGSGAIDSDGDGCPDWWELVYGLNPDNIVDGSSDDDADGLGAYYEYLVGTLPTASDTDGGGEPDGAEVWVDGWGIPLLVRNPLDPLDDVVAGQFFEMSGNQEVPQARNDSSLNAAPTSRGLGFWDDPMTWLSAGVLVLGVIAAAVSMPVGAVAVGLTLACLFLGAYILGDSWADHGHPPFMEPDPPDAPIYDYPYETPPLP